MTVPDDSRPRTILEMKWSLEWFLAGVGIALVVAGLSITSQTWYPLRFLGERLAWLALGEFTLILSGVFIGLAVGRRLR